MPEVCVDVARTMANGGALSASSAARGLKARRRPTDSVLADTDSLPPNFGSPVTGAPVSRFNSDTEQGLTKPPPPPKKPKPKVNLGKKPQPLSAKPSLPKKPSSLKAASVDKKGPLAAFRSSDVGYEDDPDRPKVKTAFVRAKSVPASIASGEESKSTGPSMNSSATAVAVKNTAVAPTSPTARRAPPPPALLNVDELAADLSANQQRPLVRQGAECAQSPEPECFLATPTAPCPTSPGSLSRQGAMRAKKGERLSYSPRPQSVSPLGTMDALRKPSAGSSVGSDHISWTFEGPLSPGIESSLELSAGSTALRTEGYSPSSSAARSSLKPFISERLSSLAPGSAGNSRSNSPERTALSPSPVGDFQTDGSKPPPSSLSINSKAESTSVSAQHSTPTGACSYEPSPSTAAVYRPSQSLSRGMKAGSVPNVASGAEPVLRAAPLSESMPATSVDSPGIASSRKAFHSAREMFAGPPPTQPRLRKTAGTRSSSSVPDVSATLPSPVSATLPSSYLRQGSPENAMGSEDSRDKIKRLCALYGGTSGVRKTSAPSVDNNSAATTMSNLTSNQIRHLNGQAMPPVPRPTSTAAFPESQPTPQATSEAHTAAQPTPSSKKPTSLHRRTSFREYLSRMSPGNNRKGDKKKNGKNQDSLNLPSKDAGGKRNQSAPLSPAPGSPVPATSAPRPRSPAPKSPLLKHPPPPKSPAMEVRAERNRAATDDVPAEGAAFRFPQEVNAPLPAAPSESPGSMPRGERQWRYESVKTLVSNSPVSSPPAVHTTVICPGSSTTPVPCTPSPDQGDFGATSASSGTPSSSSALSPVNRTSDPPAGIGNGDDVYDTVEFQERPDKKNLASKDSGYSTNLEIHGSAVEAANNLLPSVSITGIESSERHSATAKQASDDSIYDEVPPTEVTSDDEGESPYEDVIVRKGGMMVSTLSLASDARSFQSGNISLNPAAEGQRLLWQDLDLVKESGHISSMTRSEIKLQEAMFEVLSSEESYNQSLHVLTEHFMPRICKSAGGSSGASVLLEPPTIFLEKSEHHRLFSNIASLVKISDNFVQELRDRLVEQVKVDTIADIVLKHVTKNFHPYVTYCTNQTYQLQAADKLHQNLMMKKALQKMEEVNNLKLPFSTYLLQPMQRITKLPLLIVKILDYLPQESMQLVLSQQALQEVQLFVAQCNEGARSMERMEELINLQKKIKFDAKTRPVAFVSQKRYLKRSGPLVHIGGTPGKKNILKNADKSKVTVFLFNDMVIIAKLKKRPEEYYQVIDYTSLALALVEECPNAQLPHKVVEADRKRASSLLNVSMTDGKESGDSSPIRSSTPAGDESASTAFKLVFLENWDEKKNKEYILLAGSLTEKARWWSAFCDQDEVTETDGKKSVVYEMWNCPQHVVLFNYTPQQADELALQAGDVVKVLRKMEDDWCHGERLRDGTRGWFPIQFTEEIKNETERQDNLRQRRLLLAEQRQKLEASVDLS